MNFLELQTEDQLKEIKEKTGFTIIFKHNANCPVSKATRSSFEEEAKQIPHGTSIYFLDLLTYRDMSNAIANDFEVKHESPQLLLIKDGKYTFSQAHFSISADAAAEHIQKHEVK